MYADDTATLCSGGTIAEARERARQAADVMARWARAWKMRLAGNKTQVLALSQRYEDARDLHVHVDDARVNGSRHLNLLGVTPHGRTLRAILILMRMLLINVTFRPHKIALAIYSSDIDTLYSVLM